MKSPFFLRQACQQSASLAAGLTLLLGKVEKANDSVHCGMTTKNIVNATSELPFQLSKLGHPESLLPWQLEVSLLLVMHGDGTSALLLLREAQVFYL